MIRDDSVDTKPRRKIEGGYDKPVSLYPLEFEEALDALLEGKLDPTTPKRVKPGKY